MCTLIHLQNVGNFKEEDVMGVLEEFRETMLTERSKELDMILHQMDQGTVTKMMVADMIVRSVSRVKNGADVTDSPIYKVAFWLHNNRTTLSQFKNRGRLSKAITESLNKGKEEDKRVGAQTVANILNSQPFKLPEELISVKRRLSKSTDHKSSMPDLPPASDPKKAKSEAPDPDKKLSQILDVPSGLQEMILEGNGFKLVLKFQS